MVIAFLKSFDLRNFLAACLALKSVANGFALVPIF